MNAVDAASELARLKREHALAMQLLELGRQSEVEPFLSTALGLVVEAAEAQQGYLELHGEDDTPEGAWSMAHGFTPAELVDVRLAISRGIIAEALATGQTIVTPSALLDPRFSSRDSVLRSHIEAVLCAPIGEDPPRGVLYLQGRAAPGMFSVEERARADFFVRHLAPLVDRLLSERAHRRLADRTAALRATLRLDGVVGHSAALAAALEQAALVAPLNVNVLITGANGTGKTQLARVIHDNGPRATGPFVELNCANLPETLIESELFGALPGAHSTATKRMSGKVAAAEGGTLVLDEIGELPLVAQAKLLQLLQSKQYFPLGAASPEQADVRIIAATNGDLQRAMAEKQFREDLFFRLQVLPIRMPALPERREDIADLLRHFCTIACAQHDLPRLEPSYAALRAAEAAEWPGNVRELANKAQAAAIRAAGEGARHIEPRHLFPEPPPALGAPPGAAPTFQEATRRFQGSLLRDVLNETGWNVNEAAKRLDLARSHVYNLIRAFGLERTR